MRARCAVELGEATAAETLLAPVVERYPAERRREVALYLTWLAEAYARRRIRRRSRRFGEGGQRHRLTGSSGVYGTWNAV